jgi:NADPH2:quinone reductase
VQPGETVLVTGAWGSVGRTATQIAHSRGTRVISADRRDEDQSGVDSHVNTDKQDLPDAVRNLTSGRGADVVIDAVGGPLFEPALQSLARNGRYIVFASMGGTRVSFDLVQCNHSELWLLGADTWALGESADRRSSTATRSVGLQA